MSSFWKIQRVHFLSLISLSGLQMAEPTESSKIQGVRTNGARYSANGRSHFVANYGGRGFRGRWCVSVVDET